MSIFEIIMLLCFGAAWPFSIIKSYKSRVNHGKSVVFLFIIVIGYLSGIVHKLIYSYDGVIFLYILNSLMVSIDIALYYRNKRLMKKEALILKSKDNRTLV
ncbi:MAG: hypothetical protein ACOX47_12675 [Bacillota bacterium]|jgi:hypothetical protein